jgi:uncharacterized membrane-anchored protein
VNRLLTSRRTAVTLTALFQLGVLAVAVAAPLSARLTGREYLLRVAPADPVDPFRGAYLALSYPDLTPAFVGGPDQPVAERPRTSGRVFVPLTADGEVWRGGRLSRTEPSGPFLRCRDDGWQLHCGIESWFLPQGKAAAAGRALADGQSVAVVRVDARGNAALVGVRTRT